jgi:phosphoribosyl 1,2-cyclic phosphodiesterase
MQRYGGNTSCVEIKTGDPRHVVVLDAGTGICAHGAELPPDLERIDVLLTHLHMDHILGLGFFAGLFRPGLEVHVWGPSSTVLDLRSRLTRYLSPPLFPVRLRDLPCRLALHDTPLGTFEVPGLSVTAALICHPGPTVGYRLTDGRSTVAYLPDHEPALAARRFPERPEWTSGYGLAVDVDVLVHDAQYRDDEYDAHFGWGHSSVGHALGLTALVGARHLVPFHHDPTHDDAALDELYDQVAATRHAFAVTAAREGGVIDVGGRAAAATA